MYAIKINLDGLDGYSVKYRVHVENLGWLDWVSDGTSAGAIKQKLKVEAIQIKLVKNS